MLLVHIDHKEVNIDFEASAEHYPSLWQDPDEESRYAPMAAELAARMLET